MNINQCKENIINGFGHIKDESPIYTNSIIEEIHSFNGENEYNNLSDFITDYLSKDSISYFTISSKETFSGFETEKVGYSFIYSPLNDHSRDYMKKGDIVFCYRQGQFNSLDEALEMRGIYGVGMVLSNPMEIYKEKTGHNRWGVAIILPFILNKHLELRNIQLNPKTINLTPYNGNRNDALQYIEGKEHYTTLLTMIAEKNPELKSTIERVSGTTLNGILPDDFWEGKGKATEPIKNGFPLQQIFYGAPGTGKSRTIKDYTTGKCIIRTTFHPDSDYSTFVGAYKPTMTKKEVQIVPVVVNNGISLNQSQGGTYTEKIITYKFVIQAFLKAYLKAWKQYSADGRGCSSTNNIVEKQSKKNNKARVTIKINGVELCSKTSMANAGRQMLTKYVEITNGSKSVDDIIKSWNDKASIVTAQHFMLTREEHSTSNWEKFSVKDEPCFFYAGITGENWPIFCDRVKNLFDSEGYSLEISTQRENETSIEYNVQDLFDDSESVLNDKQNDKDPNPVFLIIEEINRGNCAQIFGDLFQLLDRGSNGFSEYPIEADTDLQQEIEQAFNEAGEYQLDNDINVEGVIEDYTSNYGTTLSDDIQHGRVLLLPNNLYIWATMNTSDQSLFPMDSAFKRRWSWKCVPIDYNNTKSSAFSITIGEYKYNWHQFLKSVNEKIVNATDSEDKQIGNFFINGNVDERLFIDKVMFYLWNDICKEEYHTKNNFFRYFTDEKKTETEEFTFNALFESNAQKLLKGFMNYLGVEGVKLEQSKQQMEELTQNTENITVEEEPITESDNE